MSLYGNSVREESIRNSVQLLDSTFEDDSSFILGMYVWELGLNVLDDYRNRDTIKIRLFNRAFSNANGVTVQFQTPINYKLVVGDVLYDSNRDDFLLVTEVYNLNDIHWQGKLTLCNWILKWQHPDTGEILEYPCHDINSTQYNSGEKTNKYFTIGSSQHMLTLPCDENTIILNSPKRFFLDNNTKNPTTFIVTQNDTTSYSYGKKGLIKLTVYEDVRNSETDRIDLGVCDYFEPNSKKKESVNTPKSISKSNILYNSLTIKSGGDLQNYVAKFYDDDGNENTEILPKWDIICDFKDELEVSQSENIISIGIDNDNYIDEEFKLVLSDSSGNNSSTLFIRIDSLF